MQRIYIIDEMASRWIEVGRMLKFSETDIENIHVDSTCLGDAKKCCGKLLSRWLQGHNNSNDRRPKTWETLLEVMRDARLGGLVEKLETNAITH